jgi:hypothetical protein
MYRDHEWSLVHAGTNQSPQYRVTHRSGVVFHLNAADVRASYDAAAAAGTLPPESPTYDEWVWVHVSRHLTAELHRHQAALKRRRRSISVADTRRALAALR